MTDRVLGDAPSDPEANLDLQALRDRVKHLEAELAHSLRRQEGLNATMPASSPDYLPCFREIVERMPDVLWTLDMETLRFLYVSPSVERLRGFTPAEILSQPIDTALMPEAAHALRALVQERAADFRAGRLTSAEFFTNEVQQPCKDGSAVWTEVISYFWLNPHSDRVEVHGVTRDISQRKALEHTLRFRQFSLDRIRDLVFWVDEQGRLLDVNAAVCQFLGYRYEELLTFTVGDVDPCFPFARWPEHWAELKAKGALTLESSLRDKAGRVYATEVVATYVEFEGKAYNCALVRDITERRRIEQSLRDKEERLALATRYNGVGIWDWNLETLEMLWDDSMFTLYQIRREDFSGAVDAWQHALHPDDYDRANTLAQDALAGRRPFDVEFRIVWPGGEVRHIRAKAKVFHDAAGKPVRMLGTNVDITDLKQAQADLANREEQLRLVLEGAELGYWDWNIETGTVERNARWAEMLGYTFEEIQHTAQQWSDFVHPEDRERAWQSIHAALEARTPMHKQEYRMWHKDGTPRWILDQAKVMERDAAGRPLRMSGTHTDITQRKQMENELRRQAHIDFLTDVCNRRHFIELAEIELQRAARYGNALSACMLDIDHFKRINDGFGHKVGDQVLQQVAQVCRDALRGSDIVGRVGGEEFAILLPETDQSEALEVAQRIRAALADTQMPLPGGQSLRITVSIGVTALRAGEYDLDALLGRADKALYQAKHAGRDRVCVSGD